MVECCVRSRVKVIAVIVILTVVTYVMLTTEVISNIASIRYLRNPEVRATATHNFPIIHQKNMSSQSLQIIYNRVPKCGSNATITLMKNLSAENNFNYMDTADSRGIGPEYWSKKINWQEKFTEQVQRIRRPFIFQKHLHFVDFTRFGLPQPIYINLVRDPLQRLASWFYFRRFKKGFIRRMSRTDREMSFDECVSLNKSECMEPNGNSFDFGYFKIIPFFCGQDTFCRRDSDEALAAAINNVKIHFKVVGVTEEHRQFIEALEYLYPSIFKGASARFDILEKENNDFKHVSPVKYSFSEETARKMKSLLKREYAFYNFVKDNFHELLKAIESDKINHIN